MKPCLFLLATLLVGPLTIPLGAGSDAFAQQPPYDVFPAADPPYYRVRYEGSSEPGELAYAVNYTVWIPAMSSHCAA